jgi:hypothetical protein
MIMMHVLAINAILVLVVNTLKSLFIVVTDVPESVVTLRREFKKQLSNVMITIHVLLTNATQ